LEKNDLKKTNYQLYSTRL